MFRGADTEDELLQHIFERFRDIIVLAILIIVD